MKKEYRKSVYITGFGTIRYDRDGNAQIKISADAERGTPEKVLVVAKKNLQVTPKAGDYHFSLSERGDILYSVGPGKNGDYYVRFSNLTAKPDQPPEPRLDKGGKKSFVDKDTGKKKEWFAEPQLKYDYNVVVSRGSYAGTTGRGSNPYIFEVDPETGFTKLFGRKGDVDRNEAFFDATGMAEDIPHSANVLPDLEPILKDQAATHEFIANIQYGFVRSIKALPDVEETKPARKPRAKKAKK